MKTTPAYSSKRSDLYWRVYPCGGLLEASCIVGRLLTLQDWGNPGGVTRRSVRVNFDYWPADMRLPIGGLYTDEA